jgi:hypothetical protein
MAERRLSHWQVGELLDGMRDAARPGADGMRVWNRWERRFGEQAASVEFPLGELMNRRIAGFVWAWAMQERITTHAIQRGDQFNAQGLEGKARVGTTLSTALLVYDLLPAYRCQILVETSVLPNERRIARGQPAGSAQERHPAPVAAPDRRGAVVRRAPAGQVLRADTALSRPGQANQKGPGGVGRLTKSGGGKQ